MANRKAIDLASDRQPWDRQPRESDTMYARFATYRDLGQEARTLNQTLEILKSTGDRKLGLGWLQQISSRYRWSERVEAFDADQAAANRARMAKIRREAIERHRKQAVALQGRAAQELAGLAVGSLAPGDILRFFVEGARMELGALGQPTERTAISGPDGGPVEVADVGEWSPEERRKRLRQLEGELARRLGRGGDDDDDDRVAG